MNRTLLTSGYVTPSTFVRAATVVVALGLGACATAARLPAFTPFADPVVGLDQRSAQIRRAASGLGWTVADAAPGRLELRRTASTATVDFTERNFVLSPIDPATDELRQSIVAQSEF